MRVAIVPFQFPVISETFVSNIATGLIDHGHEIGIFPLYGDPNGAGAVHPDVAKYRLKEKTYYPPQITLHRKIYLPLGLRHFYYSKFKRFDIVHFQFGVAALNCLPLKRLSFFQGKWVVSFRGFDISSFLKDRGPKVYGRLFKEADLFLSNSEYFRTRLVDLGCDRKRAFVYRSGIDCERFKFGVRRGEANQLVRIVSVGRLVEKKGFEFSIRAVIQLLKEGNNIEYLIIGGGPLHSHLKGIIEQHNAENRIKLLGPQPQDFVIGTLERAHLFVSSGVNAQDGDQNGPDNTIKEAMAIGLPVVASRSGAIQEVVEEEETGLLVPERDVGALVSKIKYLIQNPDAGLRLATAAREFVDKNYNLKQLTTELIARYQSILDKS